MHLRNYALLCLFALGAATSIANADQARALEHYERAMTHFENADFGAALAEFDRAFAEDASPVLEYNIAECHRQLNHTRLAIRHYRRYLAGVPHAEDRPEVEARLADLQANLQGEREKEKDQEANAVHVGRSKVDRRKADRNKTKANLRAKPVGRQGSDHPASALLVSANDADPLREKSDSPWSDPWLWTGVGGAIVGGIVLGILLNSTGSTQTAEAVTGNVGQHIMTLSRP